MDKEKNIEMTDDTLDIIRNSAYPPLSGEKIKKNRIRKCRVFLPEEVEKMKKKRKKASESKNDYALVDTDTLSLAQREKEEGKEKILILNMADALVPGGNVGAGVNGQEQDLCRRSTLLISLERAKMYYKCNTNSKSHIYTDSAIVSPYVLVFKDEKGDLLGKSFAVSVISCAAPDLTKQPLSKIGYEQIVAGRIEGLLSVAETMGYKDIILGAWGCGVFGGDPEIVSRTFRKQLDTFSCFETARFAIPDKKGKNYIAFAKRFPPA